MSEQNLETDIQEDDEGKNDLRGKILGYVISIVALAVIYGVINLVIVGGQYLFDMDDKKELKVIENELNAMSVALDDYEIKIENSTISESDYDDYSNMIDNYNLKIEEYNELAEKIGGTYYIVPIPIGK